MRTCLPADRADRARSKWRSSGVAMHTASTPDSRSAAIAAGHREYDFLGGESQYKSQLAAASRPLIQVRAGRPSLVERARRLVDAVIARTRSPRPGLRRFIRRPQQPTPPRWGAPRPKAGSNPGSIRHHIGRLGSKPAAKMRGRLRFGVTVLGGMQRKVHTPCGPIEAVDVMVG